MASFTDNSQALSNFNPYIQQVPVDDYVRVGLEKQQQYNQGVQQTQAAINQVAALPIMKQEQQDYLNQRLGQLRSSVSKVVGQDFSQSQLVNQIGGLTSQIAQDPIIQSGVQSTMRVQANQQKMADAQKVGKSSIANETVFGDQVQDWLKDGDVKSSFNGSYTPYTDVNKKALDAINQMHPSETIQQLPFQMKDGQVVRDAAGAPIPDAVMIQKMTKSLTAEQIQAALSGALGPDEMNQLSIDGQYQWRGASKQQLKDATDASYKDRLNQIQETLKGYAVQKMSNTNDRAYQQDLDDKIKDLGLHRDSLLSKYSTDIKSLDQNPKGYMGDMYKENWLSNMTNGYAYATNSFTYLKNPYEEDRLARDKDAREAATFNAEYGKNGFKQQELDLRKQDMLIKAEEFMMKKSGKLDANGNPIPPSLNAPVQGVIDAGHVAPPPTLTTFNATTADMNNALEGAKKNVAASIFNNIPGLPPQVVVDPTTGVLTYKDEKAKAFVETGLSALRDKWIANPASVSTAVANYFQEFDDVNNRVNNRNSALATISKKADAVANLDEIYKGISGITLGGAGLAPTGVSAKDIGAFANKLQQVYIQGQGGTAELNKDKANEIFNTPVEKVLYKTFERYYEGNEPLTPSNQVVINKIREVQNRTNANAPKVEARNAWINKAIPNLSQTEIPASFPINTAKPERKNEIEGLANNLVDNFQKQGAGELPGGADIKDIGKIFKLEKGTTYSLEAQGNNQYALKLSNVGSGIPAQSIPLTRDQVNQYFPEANINQFAAVKEALALAKYTDRSSTDVQGNGSTSAFVLQNPNLNKYSVRYHVEDPHRDGQYQIKAYVLDRSIQQAPNQPPVYQAIDVPLPSFLGEKGLSNFISTFGDQEVEALLALNKK